MLPKFLAAYYRADGDPWVVEKYPVNLNAENEFTLQINSQLRKSRDFRIPECPNPLNQWKSVPEFRKSQDFKIPGVR